MHASPAQDGSWASARTAAARPSYQQTGKSKTIAE